MMVTMFSHFQKSFVPVLSLLLMLMITPDVSAASRRNCNRNLVVTEVSQLNFGNFVGTIGGKVTVSPAGARTTSGPVLVGGGTVSPAVFSLHTTIAGCESYRVRIRFNNGNLPGPGPRLRVDNLVSDPPSMTFTLNPGANNPVFVNVGGDVSSATNQTSGVYTGTYRARFSLRN